MSGGRKKPDDWLDNGQDWDGLQNWASSCSNLAMKLKLEYGGIRRAVFRLAAGLFVLFAGRFGAGSCSMSAGGYMSILA